MKAIINGRIITKERILDNKVLIFDEHITEIENKDSLADKLELCDELIDAKGEFVSPGLIDIHIHGSGGQDTMDGSVEALKIISETIVQNGVTGFLPTTMTMSQEYIIKALDSIRISMNQAFKGAKVLGAHMEGPFINPKLKGAQKGDYIIPPDYNFIADYKDVIKIITIAPEMDEKYEFIKNTKKNSQIVISIGHSDATYEEAIEAINHGVSHATHTFNAMTPLNHRKPGIVGAVFNSDIYCEIIADNIHVHPAVMNILSKMKKKEKIVLITDSMRAGCLKDGISELGGQKVIVKDNSARLEDGTLAGSILNLNKGIKNFIDATDVSICEAVNMATINPARELGIDDVKGSLEVGKSADIVIFDNEFNIIKTIVEGNTVYNSTKGEV